MQLFDLFEQHSKPATFMDALRDFLPLALSHLSIKQIPAIHLTKSIHDETYPTFGRFNADEGTILLAINQRHPVDILRTLAHELVHYGQNERGEITPDSGETGSDIENEANAEAGVIMRLFSQQYPQYLKLIPFTLP